MNAMPTPTRHAAPARERGNAAGALVFGLVMLAIAVGGYLWLQSRNARLEASQVRSLPSNGHAADKWTQRLGTFLRAGPTSGTWRTIALNKCVYTNYIAPHPTEADHFLIAQIDKQGMHKPLVVARWLVGRHFFRAPEHLFFSNYERTDGPIREELEDGTKTWRVHWGPRYNHGGLTDTERLVWFTEIGGEVVQIEDRSRTGHTIRVITRTSKETGAWKPQDHASEDLERHVGAEPDRGADGEQGLRRACEQAPFDVYQPGYLPPGFVLVRASYSVCDASLTPSEDQPAGAPPAPETPVQLVTQLYSDGLALISVGVSSKEDMNVIENLTAGMPDTDDPASCPGLPADARDLRQNGSVIRMRTDTCRVVLRRDDLEGVSVTIIGRNELPVEEYLRIIGTLKRVQTD